MIRLRNLAVILLWLGTVSLASYEIVQKSPLTPLGPLPGAELAELADPSTYIGRAPSQVDAFLRDHVAPLLDRHAGDLEMDSEVNV